MSICLHMIILHYIPPYPTILISVNWYLDNLLNSDNNFFDSIVNHFYFLEIQLNTSNVSDTRPRIWIYMLVIKVRHQNFSNKDKDIINFVRRFQTFIGGILT